MSLIGITNFTDLINGTGIIGYATQGYITTMGFFFYPLFFSGIIGYVYMKQQSLVALAVVILIVFTLFGDLFLGVTMFVILMHIITALIISGLILGFLIYIRR